ncbi:ABC transporter ATP-binding protein [Bifidobacterium rousetti]|uniref:ATP-binding cassette domain-containing protein n=1 Tax=Bifidobacterium rousetti TaxID=2045439 RepID=UPI00123A0D0A|nr:ATP-binding cassette domain-containing protein [Bifidobacterium rousetti]KAA8819715.1 ABC transporter ATP-binding protein [Bifidobacterium rousetti]
MQRPSIITLNDITFTYPDAPEPLFDGVGASFPIGWSAVLGDNGIGKSTLMAIIRGVVRPNRGTITPDPGRLVIGYCPQDVAVPPPDLETFAADWSPESIAIRDDLDLADDWPYRYDTLSGGERRRVQIACALALRPDVLILDEPTNHVDAATRERIVSAMRRYRGVGIVVSHDAELIDRTCGRCVVFARRHVGSRNVTVVDTYQGGYGEVSARIDEERESDAVRLDAARRETARLEAVRAQRFAKVQRVEAAKRDGGRRADPKDSDARNRRQLAKMTGLDRGVTRAYGQLDGRLAAARRHEVGLAVAAKRYDGDIWMDIEPSRRRELIRLEAGVIRFGRTGVVHGEDGYLGGIAGRSDARNPSAGTGPDGICRATWDAGRIRISPPDIDMAVDGAVRGSKGLAIPLISIGPRDHIAITGPNGTGKSTLLRAMLADATVRSGDIPRLVIAQNTTDADAERAMTRLASLLPSDRSRVLGAYARLNADPDRLLAGGSPSPGELRKLLLCLALPERPRLIVMDEPTNHLDMASKEALARLLRGYPGALVLVSHDERFLGEAGCVVPR